MYRWSICEYCDLNPVFFPPVSAFHGRNEDLQHLAGGSIRVSAGVQQRRAQAALSLPLMLKDPMVNLRTLTNKVLAQPNRQEKFTPRDYVALMPLIWEHVNPLTRMAALIST